MPTRRDVMKTLAGGGFAAALPFAPALPARAAESDAVSIGYPADVPNWDPISAGTPFTNSVFKCVFDKPLNLNPDLTFGPSVVSAYRFVDTTGKTLEFEFRPGVTFQNGDPLTSDDFKFTYWDRLKQDRTLALGGSWSVIDGIETPSPAKAILHLKAPQVAAPPLIADATSYIMPRRYFEKVGKDGFMAKPIGSGPYRLVDYQRDSRIVLEAYDKYWGGPAKIKTVTFQIIKDASARIAAVQAGQIDLAINLPVREVLRLGALPNLVGNLHPITNVILMHMVNKGIYKDKNLRLAMHHAIDKEALSKAFFGGKAATLSMWSGPGMPAYDPNFHFGYDPAKAKALLAASGYSMDKPAKIEFTTFNGVFPSDFDIGRAIVQMFKQVGIDANLSILEITKYSEMARNDKIEVPALYTWFNGSGDPYIYSGTILDPRKIFSVWKSDDITPKLDPLYGEVDYKKRMDGYRAFDKWAVEEGYEVPLLQATATVVHSKRVGYVPFNNGWVLPYYWTLS